MSDYIGKSQNVEKTPLDVVSAPSKSRRLNSPNTSNWEPDVRMLLSTLQWLQVCLIMYFMLREMCWLSDLKALYSTRG